jgi:hypothetical protein
MLLLLIFPDTSSAFAPDTTSYLDYANAIINGHFWDYPSAIRTPVYPLFLAIFQSQIVLTILTQMVLSVVTVFFTYQIAKMMFYENNIAFLASILLAFSLESITHSYYLLSETLFTFFLVASIYAFIHARKSQKISLLILSALLLSLSILTRPFALFFPVILIGFIIFDKKPCRSRIKNTFVFISFINLLIGGWMVRNLMVVGVATISSISSQNLLYYNAASLVADQTDRNELEVREMFVNQVATILDEKALPDTEANRYKIEKESGIKIILADPLQYACIHLKSDLNNLLPDTDILEILGFSEGQKGTLDMIKQKGLWAGVVHYFDGDYRGLILLVPFIILLLITYIGASIAIFRLFQKKRFYELAILLLPITYGLLLPGSPSNPRFRVPIMPFLVILAAYGLIYLYSNFRNKIIINHRTL